MRLSLLDGLRRKPLAIRVIGDHSAYHCGSAAAWQSIMTACAKGGRIALAGEDWNILVVNGEGSMHHDSKSCKQKLGEIADALNVGKKVYLMNTVWQANDPTYADILRRCERVTVREVKSQRELAQVGVHSDVAIDQSFFLPIAEAAITDFEGRPVLTDFYSKDLGTFARVTTKWTWPQPYIQMHEWQWSSLVRSLPTARVLLTGRHHAVYAACRARVPFLALKGNTHKIEGLIETANVDIPIFSSYKELIEAYQQKRWLEYNYQALFDWMDAQRPWSLATK